MSLLSFREPERGGIHLTFDSRPLELSCQTSEPQIDKQGRVPKPPTPTHGCRVLCNFEQIL